MGIKIPFSLVPLLATSHDGSGRVVPLRSLDPSVINIGRLKGLQ